MGKRITLYLTDNELDMIEKICALDGVGPNMSKTLKMGLSKMFQSCHILKGDCPVLGDELITAGLMKEESKAITAHTIAKKPFSFLDILSEAKAQEQRKDAEIEAKKVKARAEAEEFCKQVYNEVEQKEKENPTPVDARRVHR